MHEWIIVVVVIIKDPAKYKLYTEWTSIGTHGIHFRKYYFVAIWVKVTKDYLYAVWKCLCSLLQQPERWKSVKWSEKQQQIAWWTALFSPSFSHNKRLSRIGTQPKKIDFGLFPFRFVLFN